VLPLGLMVDSVDLLVFDTCPLSAPTYIARRACGSFGMGRGFGSLWLLLCILMYIPDFLCHSLAFPFHLRSQSLALFGRASKLSTH
jgi:hypothetical protein